MGETMFGPYNLYINGEWVRSASGERYQRTSPSTGELVADFAKGTQSDARKAIESARQAFDSGVWSDTSGAQRAAVLHKVADLLRANAEETARQEAAQVGIPYRTIGWLNWYVADVFDYFAGMARHIVGRSVLTSSQSLSFTLRQPIGVVAVISPWNFPLVLSTWKIASALAAGCTVLVKPASYTPITVLELAKLFEAAGLPAGAYNVVTGPGNVIGDVIVDSPDVNAIAFTGETVTGKALMARASKTLKHVSLELGGKSPMIVHHDANLDRAADAAMEVFYNAGQVCNLPARLIVHDDVYQPFMEKFVARTRALRVGRTFDDDADMGPVVSRGQLETVMGYIETGKKEGAHVVLGGDQVRGAKHDQGYFVAPTIFDEVNRNMTIAKEEIFCPVATAFRYRDLEEAIDLANDSPFGLTAGIWTANLDAAHACARRLNAGTIWINVWNKSFPEIPVGGNKESGFGRELGIEGMYEFTVVKGVHIFPAA